MKKLLSVLSSTLQGGVRGGLLFLALVATTSLWAYDFSLGDLRYTITSSSAPYTVEVSKSWYDITSAIIPETVTNNGTTYSVTSIGYNAFYNCYSLTSITIPNSVTSIGNSAFDGCSSLTSVTIPNSVTNIGDEAFCWCSSLTSITIPNSVTSIGNSAFDGCSSLTSVTIGNSVTSIGWGAFYECSSLTSVTIPNSVTSIDFQAFAYCSSLTSVTIPNSVTSIGEGAFYNCESLTKTNYTGDIAGWCDIKFGNPDANPMYYSHNFYINDQEIKDLVIPNSIDSIHNYAFYGCSSLTSITIPNSVTSIGGHAFLDCSSLTSVTIPEGVMSIGGAAFYGCSKLKSVAIPNSVTSIGVAAFYGCSKLKSVAIPNSVTSIGERTFCDCSSLTSVTIPNSVTSIGNEAFRNCSSLTSITIPNGVTSIGESAFADCDSLTSVVWNAKNCADSPFGGIRSQIRSFTFGDSVEHIPANLCRDMKNLTSLIIPESVTSIGNYAFDYCTSVYTVVWNAKNCADFEGHSAPFEDSDSIISFSFGDSVKHIPANLCRDMKNLTSLIIPESVTSIGGGAFAGCSGFTSITIPNSVTSIGESAFADCDSLTSVVWNAKSCADFEGFSTPFYDVYAYEYTGNYNIISFSFGDSVEHIPAYLCHIMKELTSLTIPESVTSIGENAFDGCSSLTSVIWNAKNCADFDSYEDPFGDISSQIRSFTFGDSVKHIPANLCYDMTNLTSLTIPNSVTNIGDFAFCGCSKLKSINIPENVTSIGSYAFNACSSLTSITIPSCVTSIGSGAFSWCESLASVVWNMKNCVDFDYNTSPFRCYGDNNDVAFSITSFIFGDSVEYIPAYLCYLMQNLKSITIPDGVTSIGKNAFYDCDSLTSVTIGNSVTNIGEYAFYDCSSIDTVVWNAKNCADFEWSSSPFRYSNDSITLFSFGDSVKHIPAHLCEDKKNLTSLTIPNSVTSIGGRAFSGCSSVTSLTLGNNLTTIGSYAFSSLNALTSVTQKAPSIEAYCQGQVSKLLYDSASLNKNAIRTIEINGEEVADWVIPSSITKIEDYTFYNCPSITSVALPNTITSIGKSAFENCISIAAITIPNKVTRIGARAFSKCPITDVIIPNNVTNIGGSAFSNCDKLSSLILGESVDSIGGGAFYGCRKLYDIYCYAPEPPYAIASGWSPSFENFNVNLYVPCDNLKAFQMDPVFGTFKYIHCIDSEDVPADGVIITPGFTDVTITWPTDDDADNYIIVIEKDGEVVCTLTFNAEGQLLNISFAPGRNGNHPAQYAEQAANGGFRFTVTGLEEGTNYTYDITATDESDNTLATHSGEFTTQSNTPTAIEHTNSLSSKTNCYKIIRGNQLFIIRDGKTYNVMGKEL